MMDVFSIIACPACKSKLTIINNKLNCPAHGDYKISERGIPILFTEKADQTYLDGETTYKDEKRNSRINFIKKRIFRKPKMYFGKSLHDRIKKQYIDDSPRDKIILNIGSGHDKRFGQENFINFDIYPHWNTHVSGDAHELPFLNNSIDVVWLCAVLEHIHNPFQVMDEVYRVLKPGGTVLLSVPFIQYLHASPHDYFRYTKYGVRSICSRFEEIESGASYTGPMGTLLQLISVLPHLLFQNKAAKNFLSFLFAWLFSPLLLLDLFFKNKDHEILTGGICYLGRK